MNNDYHLCLNGCPVFNMRIIYAADIHGSFERVKTLLSETVADVYVIAGDLIDIPFYNMNTAIHYHELQPYFHGLRARMNKECMNIEDFVDELLDMPKFLKRSKKRHEISEVHNSRSPGSPAEI